VFIFCASGAAIQHLHPEMALLHNQNRICCKLSA